MLYKHTCSCGNTWCNEDKDDDECMEHDDWEVETTSELTGDDYVKVLEEDLENANYHGMTHVPSQIYGIISKMAKTKKHEIMKAIYEKVDWL